MNQTIQTSDLTIQIEAVAKSWEAWRHTEICKKYPGHSYEFVTVLYAPKFAKLVIDNAGVQAFIALVDGENKTIGPYKAGDIFYPASWSAPAKHKRGSVFNQNPLACFGPWGVKTLTNP